MPRQHDTVQCKSMTKRCTTKYCMTSVAKFRNSFSLFKNALDFFLKSQGVYHNKIFRKLHNKYFLTSLGLSEKKRFKQFLMILKKARKIGNFTTLRVTMKACTTGPKLAPYCLGDSFILPLLATH